MEETKGSPARGSSPDTLERTLHNLPQPPAPDGLEERLISSIPQTLPARPRPLLPYLVMIAAAAAAMLLALAIFCAPPAKIDSQRTLRGNASLSSTSPLYIVLPKTDPYKETRPCDILPPLPDWYSP